MFMNKAYYPTKTLLVFLGCVNDDSVLMCVSSGTVCWGVCMYVCAHLCVCVGGGGMYYACSIISVWWDNN
jgi:hypothetical protein